MPVLSTPAHEASLPAPIALALAAITSDAELEPAADRLHAAQARAKLRPSRRFILIIANISSMPRRVKEPNAADIVVHPQRLEIMRALELHGAMTVREIGKRMRGISEASLYRHVRKLSEAGFLRVVETREKERGAPETVFALAEQRPESFRLIGEDRSAVTLQRYLMAIQAAQLAELASNARQGEIIEGFFALRYSEIYVDRKEQRELQNILARLKEFESNSPLRRTALSLSLALFPARRA
jgi:DNA-binding transcriptional ArsR family regulator